MNKAEELWKELIPLMENQRHTNEYCKRPAIEKIKDYAQQREGKELEELKLMLQEEFLVNTQNYPEEYHDLFHKKFNRAMSRFDEWIKTQQ
jgi:vacuolar-type H+-ATPase subunit B/Vma2